jgi:SAM-dependent methyltransferase
MTDDLSDDPAIVALLEKLQPIRQVIDQVNSPPRPATAQAAAALIERHRPAMYAVMFDLGAAIHRFEQSNPSPEQLVAARGAIISVGRALFPTNPMMTTGHRGTGRRLPYFELVELLRSSFTTSGEPAPMLLSDFAINSVAGKSFRNRLELAAAGLREEIAQRLAAGHRPLALYSLHYLGGSELLHLAQDRELANGVRITCMDGSPAAVRHAELTLEPAFKRRITFHMADAERWLNGPACPREEACIVYCVSLLEQVDSKSALRILRGAYNLLRDGGVLLMGSVTAAVPIEEQRLRAWVLSWEWHYRTEAEWRELFSRTPFRPEDIVLEYEPLGAGVVIRARRCSTRLRSRGPCSDTSARSR